VARDFDKLVHDLRGVSQQIRQSAEDKAHSFKTPLAAIRSALEPVRRAMPGDNQRARRALEIVDSSLARLLDLVIAAQRHDLSTADLIETPRVPTDFTQLIGDAALTSAKSSPARTSASFAASTSARWSAPARARSKWCCRTCWKTPSASRRAAARSS
jgi:two-component system sensor histidine kinase ChvG